MYVCVRAYTYEKSESTDMNLAPRRSDWEKGGKKQERLSYTSPSHGPKAENIGRQTLSKINSQFMGG